MRGPCSKVAVTIRSAVMATLQVVPLVLSQPAQPANVKPASGDAVSDTAVPESSEALQAAPQLIAPPAPVTVPVPLPPFSTLSVYWTRLKVAVTVRLPVMVTLQVVPLVLSQPAHPANAEPGSAEAVSASAVP
jgi:hypothetical protein